MTIFSCSGLTKATSIVQLGKAGSPFHDLFHLGQPPNHKYKSVWIQPNLPKSWSLVVA